MTIDPRLHRIVAAQPYPLLFATISGAHLHGFPSPDSVEDSRIIEGLEMDIISHDVRKFFGLLLKKNGYVLEHLFSPLIVHTTPEHSELKTIAPNVHHQTSLAAHDASHLPEFPTDQTRAALNDLLLRVRLA